MITDILKPKSSLEISSNIKKLSLFEFIYNFKKYKFKELKRFEISIKKLFLFFMIETLPKTHNKIYFPTWFLWLFLCIIKHIHYFKTHHTLFIVISKAEIILFCVIMVLGLISISSTVLIFKYKKFIKQKISILTNDFIDHINAAFDDHPNE